MLFWNLFRKNILPGVLFLCVSIQSEGKPFFKLNERCLKAQSLIYELRLEEAGVILQNEMQISPENLAIPWLQESCLFISLFISENESEFHLKQKNWEAYIAQAENLKTLDPWHRFIISDMLLHRAAVKLKMNDHLSAGKDIKKANDFLKKNEAEFPGFLPDNKNAGLINCLFSAVPENYQWIAKLLGIEGNLEAGMKKLEEYLESDLDMGEQHWLKVETAFIYSLLQYHFMKDPDAAWLTIEPYTRTYKTSIMLNYMRATIAGYAGKNNEQIFILSQRPIVGKAVPFYYMDYMLGIAKLRMLDMGAETHFKKFTIKFKGQHHIKSAYRYLAWCHLLQSDIPTANTYYSLCKKSGKALQEEDIQAEKEANDTNRCPASLLRSRLLFDGHYYNRALQQLESSESLIGNDKKHLLEFNYRKARLYFEMKDYSNAILLFDKVITLGRNESYYYAAYSALYMGLLYEQLNKREQAGYYFRKAKNDFPENREYRNSIEQKSKIGLKRLGM